MEHSPEKENKSPVWFKHKKALNQVLLTIRRQSLKQTKPLTQTEPTAKSQDCILTTSPSPVSDRTDGTDRTSLISDDIMLKILSKVPKSHRNANFLVSRRWLNLQGRLVRSVKVLDWDFLDSGRLFTRFPNLIRVDLVNGCLSSGKNSGICCTHKILSFHVGSDIEGSNDWFFDESFVLDADEVDKGLRGLASGCPNLRKLVVVNASEIGIVNVAEECGTLQELELHMCNDHVLRGIAACQNLQILRLSGIVDGFYGSYVSDVGLTIVAQGCKRLVKLELSGCTGSYEGIRAIGQCCVMLEELTLSNHKMEDGWLLALSYCENLKSLKFLSCKSIDVSSGLDEYVGSCVALESLRLEKCQLRDKGILRALFVLCRNVKEVFVRNCWGLDDDMFSTASEFRGVRFLTLEGCSLLTTSGLESVITYWNELQSLKVKSCNKIKDSEVTPELSGVFSTLKGLTWKPDTKCRLTAHLAGTGMGKRGGKFFKKSCDWKF